MLQRDAFGKNLYPLDSFDPFDPFDPYFKIVDI